MDMNVRIMRRARQIMLVPAAGPHHDLRSAGRRQLTPRKLDQTHE